MGRPQVVRVGNNTSAMLIFNTGAPQGCVLSPLLYSLFTHDCKARHNSNTIIKFADDTTVVGQIMNNDETAMGGGHRPGRVVPGQQPLLQLDQDKGDDCGLQEKEDRANPHSHRWGCLAQDRKALQIVLRMAQYITGAKLPAIQDLYTRLCQRKALKMIKDSSHPSH